MTVSVDIQVASRAQAVLVPTDAIHDADPARPWVLKVAGHRARRQSVRIGLHGGGVSEVLEGLRPGDLVVPQRATFIADGSRLRAVVASGRRGEP
ncbi:hypothetical protein QTI66_29835 [Variovorax sp. J22R133]|uniref:hypothetical protein n=1 Tax=Variovorax brevis TaxID=3053503 RepID=UPI0025788B7A|nr:hypothetical protein [Variovorax sp. J22R133]MDM0116360.1 hypothetical protein [Variovorax sp. J22R133]